METGAEVLMEWIVMNIKGRLTRNGYPIDVKHIAQVLNEDRK